MAAFPFLRAYQQADLLSRCCEAFCPVRCCARPRGGHHRQISGVEQATNELTCFLMEQQPC